MKDKIKEGLYIISIFIQLIFTISLVLVLDILYTELVDIFSLLIGFIIYCITIGFTSTKLIDTIYKKKE